MPFIEDILKYKSVAIVGLEKNTGKTECLNYVLKRLQSLNKLVALTSIGLDGENIDAVSNTSKPEIEIYKDIVFSTSEKHYKEKRLTSEILSISTKKTSLGRLVTAKAIIGGKVILSGPPDTFWLKMWLSEVENHNIDLAIVDGALSRLSTGSPVVTDAIILNTGAAVSTNFNQLINKTKFTVELINLSPFISSISEKLLKIEKGVWSIDENEQIHNLKIPSVLMIEKYKHNLFTYGTRIFISGIITDKLLDYLRIQKKSKDIILIAKDFTKLFISRKSYISFIKSGAKLEVLLPTNLISVCVNPISPNGFKYNSDEICKELSLAINLPVYDVLNFK